MVHQQMNLRLSKGGRLALLAEISCTSASSTVLISTVAAEAMPTIEDDDTEKTDEMHIDYVDRSQGFDVLIAKS